MRCATAIPSAISLARIKRCVAGLTKMPGSAELWRVRLPTALFAPDKTYELRHVLYAGLHVTAAEGAVNIWRMYPCRGRPTVPGLARIGIQSRSHSKIGT